MDSKSLNSTAPPPKHQNHHAVLFPFMSKGHTIPLLHLATLLLRRRLSVTVITTPANRPFIATSLSDTAASILDLPFPADVHPDIPAGVESTDRIPSMSLFFPFAAATVRMQPEFERLLDSLLPPVSFFVTDAFLWWTLESASKFRIPRLVYFGMCNYSYALCKTVFGNRLIDGPESDDELITVIDFPWIKITKNDFEPEPRDPDLKDLAIDFQMNCVKSTANSFGMVVNSFYELEPVFVDYCNRKCPPKPWCVGPLCLADPITSSSNSNHLPPPWIRWLDQKLEQGSSVLYVAFGSQADISDKQFREIAIGLGESKMNFLWVTKRKSEWDDDDDDDGLELEERVKERGMIVRDWVKQREILNHKSVEGFLSHCGWNSVIESICAGVPILAWPMMAEQHLNARMVAEEIKIGLRVETCDRSVRGFVKREGLAKTVRELMEGEKGKEARWKVREFAEMAEKSHVEEEGSSWHSLISLIDEVCADRG